ncbi:hypothetical protein [Hymenobacter cellulosilyticus]|uniref:Uncharacterized protein n=1 Tax=Hymenobacter cellulosilyticus TaxID=2932248 RepID=A0A8T9Q2T0_9BACT|nr:hypothetical protein [Hymenobacter cellulosilyticus]UOQ71335.1 hypothetical protein MUN79_22310 [Hymenobacter cellulosilyticus]
MKLTVVGGCFPVQHNISQAGLYHQTLKRELQQTGRVAAVEVDVIRYERFQNCLAKIAASHARQPIGALLFHLRAEPVLRLLKLYYRYLDDAGRLRHALNLPFLQLVQPEKYDLLTVRPRTPAPIVPRPETPRRRRLRELNYRAGYVLGNRRFAFRQYERLVNSILEFCTRHAIPLVIIGPVSRPASVYENQLSAALHEYIASRLPASAAVQYLNPWAKPTSRASRCSSKMASTSAPPGTTGWRPCCTRPCFR